MLLFQAPADTNSFVVNKSHNTSNGSLDRSGHTPVSIVSRPLIRFQSYEFDPVYYQSPIQCSTESDYKLPDDIQLLA